MAIIMMSRIKNVKKQRDPTFPKTQSHLCPPKHNPPPFPSLLPLFPFESPLELGAL